MRLNQSEQLEPRSGPVDSLSGFDGKPIAAALRRTFGGGRECRVMSIAVKNALHMKGGNGVAMLDETH